MKQVLVALVICAVITFCGFLAFSFLSKMKANETGFSARVEQLKATEKKAHEREAARGY